MALAVFLGIGLTWGADPSTLEELAAAIEGVRTGPDGERVVVSHISRKVNTFAGRQDNSRETSVSDSRPRDR